ncbi:unnamed protein product, partial [Amoebophrya sp. A25]|eukprot:GSA25T00024560001.1
MSTVSLAFRTLSNWKQGYVPLRLIEAKHPVTGAFLVSSAVLNAVLLQEPPNSAGELP